MEFGLFFNLIISVLVIILLLTNKYTRKKVSWLEYILIICIPLLFSTIFMTIVLNVQSNSIEYWGSTIEYIYEEEPYNEWVHKTCSESYACGTDANGNTEYCTRYYDCSYQDDVCASWWAITTIGERICLTETKYYEILKTNFNKREIIETKENYDDNDEACSYRGSKFYNTEVGEYSYTYKTKCSQTLGDVYPIVSKHRYKNKVKSTDYSALGFQYIDTTEVKHYQLYEYPKIESDFYQTVFLGNNISRKTQELYNDLNGLIGYQKECKLFICIFNEQPIDAGLKQQSYWVGGNKNELIITIGIKGDSINWVYPFSWSKTKSNDLLINIENKIKTYHNINDDMWNELAPFLYTEILSNFNRLEFEDPAEGFEYLKIKVPTWSIITNIILSLIVIVVVVIISLKNDYDNNL